MKKIRLDKQYLKICFYVILVVFCAIVFEKSLGNLHVLYNNVIRFFQTAARVMAPFIYGFFIAYFLNSCVRMVENKLLGRIQALKDRPKLNRSFSILATYIVFIGCIVWVIAYIIPEISDSIRTIITNLQYWEASLSYLTSANENILANALEMINETFQTQFTLADFTNMILDPVLESMDSIPKIISTVFTGTVNIASLFINLILGLVIGFYMLGDKEHFGKMLTKFLYVAFKPETKDKIIELAKSSNKIFENFFIGKTIDSLIIGLLFFISSYLLIKPPYIVLLSVIIGVTNMIPYFGPFIGGVPVVLIVLLNDPMKALWLALLILCIQQLDGIVIGPKILGSSTGVKPIGVVFAILIGGSVAGVLGMFIGVPVFAIVRNVSVAWMNKRYEEKQEQFAAGWENNYGNKEEI